MADVFVAMFFEILGDVESGCGEDSFIEQEERDEDATESPIAVEERMEEFELRMDDRELNQSVAVFGVIILFPLSQGLQHDWRRWRNE